MFWKMKDQYKGHVIVYGSTSMSPSFIMKSAKKYPIFYGLQNMMSFQKWNLNPLIVDSLIIWYIPLL